MQLGCGMMYMDDGDSLEVPPVGEERSLLLFLSSMVVSDSLQGWLWAVPATADLAVDAKQQSQRSSDDAPKQNDAAAAAQAHNPMYPDAKSPGLVSDKFQKAFQHCKHHITQAHWAAAAVGDLFPTDAPAGRHAAATGAHNGDGAGSNQDSKKVLHLPYVEEILVLGVAPPDDGRSYVVWMDEQQLVMPEQVKYDASHHVLRVTLGVGQQPVAAQLTMSWGPAAEPASGCCAAA
jgi:hypothetical protein